MFKIFVGNLSSSTTEEAIRRLFSRYAEVEDIALPLDTETGKPRGFAIVMIKDEIRAKGAMIALRGARLDGRALVINQARKKGEAPKPKRDRRNSTRYRMRAGRLSSGEAGGGRDSRGPRQGGAGGDSSRPSRGYGGPNWRPGGGRPSGGRPPRDET